MAPHLPVEDPYDGGSLMDRSLSYVRSSKALRIALWVTAIDHAAVLALVIAGRIERPEAAGVFALFSVLAWFFAVCMPVMNRTLRARFGEPETGYWSELVEMFGCVVLCVQTAFYTGIVAWAAAGGF
ncbi:MAG: hypothetical protein L6Q95_00505 [Planctomycetes bacterium]|nr:hypothetical protein [Planctomycetota bacterium]